MTKPFDPTEHGSNRSRTGAFRDDVVLYMQEAGIVQASRPPQVEPTASTTAQGSTAVDVTNRPDLGDLTGTSFFIAARCQQTLDLSGSMDKVALRAHEANIRLFAGVFHRRGHQVGDAYVVMPLHVFVNVLAQMPPRKVGELKYPSEYFRADLLPGKL